MTQEEILEAIETHEVRTKFPAEILDTIEKNWDTYKPVFLDALKKVGDKKADQKTIDLSFFGMHYLAYFREKEAFPLFIRVAYLDSDSLEMALGDVLTEYYEDFLYVTYDGNLKLLLDLIMDESADEFAKGAALRTLGQMWEDGTYSTEDWKKTLLELSGRASASDTNDFHTVATDELAECHFPEYLPMIREKLQNHDIAEMEGDYSDHVDIMYGEDLPEYTHKDFNAREKLLFFFPVKAEPEKEKEPDLDGMLRDVVRDVRNVKRIPVMRAGRNDPCPCGSGKKYKNCCMRKDEEAAKTRDEIEPYERKLEYLSDYPRLSFDPVTDQKLPPFTRKKGAVYLEDYYDHETIRTDALIYLGMKKVPPIILMTEKIDVPARQIAYLRKAWQWFTKKYTEEKDTSLDAYDKKHMIHYAASEWIGALIDALREKDNTKEADKVVQFLKTTVGIEKL